MPIAYVRKQDIPMDFKDGYAQTEMLPGVYAGGVRAYRCELQAGCTARPPMYPGTLQVFCFTQGCGAITTPAEAFAINEVSFYVADPEATFAVHAATGMEFTMFVVTQTEHDQKRYRDFHVKMPHFQPLSACVQYCQECKSPATISYSIIPTKRLCRILMGAVEASAVGKNAPEGTFEEGHPAVAQWNVLFGNSDLHLTVDGETVDLKTGDFSYVPAGLDHSLECLPGQELHYIWFEHYVQEVDYLVSNPHR